MMGRVRHQDTFSMLLPVLRPYQQEPLRAILRSVYRREGHTFTVMMSRQAGKNELSAQLEARLLVLQHRLAGDGVKASPTFRPQTLNSMHRLKRRLLDLKLDGYVQVEHGFIIRVQHSRMLFFSAAPEANVVGATASLILELDEAQDIAPDKYLRDFRPMGATANVTTVLYGTAWDDRSLLEQVKQQNLELERRDGVRRHFEYDWQQVAAYNPDYARYVAAERDRLGEDHPLFRTQYALRTIAGEGRAFSATAQAQLLGDHPRQHVPAAGRVYVAGIDLAGEAEEGEDAALRAKEPRRDSTVVTIAEVVFSEHGLPPALRIVQIYRRTGVRHAALYGALVDLLGRVWRCRQVVVDATGVGAGVASFLRGALGSVVRPFVFSTVSKSELAFQLLAAIGNGRVQLYADDDEDARAFRQELALARTAVRPGGLLNLFVDPAEGHDDYVMSLALLVAAAEGARPRLAFGRQPSPERSAAQ